MTLITGTIKDSGGLPIATGILRVKLDAPLVDTSTTPDSLHTQAPREFAITNGALPAIDLPESGARQITYEFTLFSTATVYTFYFADGSRYDGPTVLHTDSKWYTGYTKRPESQELDRVATTERTQIDQFHTIVPNQASVEYTQLIPTRISTDTLPSAVRQIADILVSTPAYRNQLRGGPNPQGTYSPTIFYQLDDQVELDGSSYIYINKISTQGNQPPNATYWQLLAARGATGTGTSGNSTPYNATTWNTQTDAPSRGAVRNIIETLAKLTDIANLASIISPTFTGNPARSTNPLSTDNSQQIPTTNWVRNLFAPLISPVFTGNPAVPTQPLSDASQKAASTEYVTNKLNDYQGGVLFIASRNATQTLTNGAWVKVAFNTEEYDPKNLFNTANNTFTVPATDWYELSGLIYFTFNAGTLSSVDVSIYQTALTTRFASIGVAGVTQGWFPINSPPLLLQAATEYEIRMNVVATNPGVGVDAALPNRILLRRLKVN
jgi:hypothetical protein